MNLGVRSITDGSVPAVTVPTVTTLDWLTLTAPEVDRLADFYQSVLGLEPADSDGLPHPTSTTAFAVPPGRLCLRPVTEVPSGGVHTHFAVTVTPDRYDEVYERLEADGPVVERTFGGRRSLYRIDPAGHCVEFGERPGLDEPVGPIFEVVLEVNDLDRAIDRYAPLGFDPMDRDLDRPRCRLRGPFDLELWEPHIGIGDARGGCHVDLGVTVDEPDSVATTLEPTTDTPRTVDDRLLVRDPDGHTWWLGSS